MSNIVEDGIEAGTWNKYQSRNPVQRALVRRFLATVCRLATPLARPGVRAVDVGCGEGVTTRLLHDCGFSRIVGWDFSARILEVARRQHPDLTFEQRNVYEITSDARFEFVAACEVLEHLDHPGLGLERLASLTGGHCLLSVPNEPLFRTLNFLAGKYWRRWGNSPGHLNHWSATEFIRFVGERFKVLQVRRPLPWTVVLCQPR